VTSAAVRERLSRVNSWLLAGLFFVVPTTIAPAYWLMLLILVLWLLQGGFAQKWLALRGNSVFWVFQAYFWMFPLALLWTEDLSDGRRMVSRALFFLLSPVLLTVARPEQRWRYLGAFLIGVTMCELLAYYNWLQLHVLPALPDGIRVDKDPFDTAPFVDRIMYTPVLAMAGYVAGHQVVFGVGRIRLLCALSLALTFGNLVFSGGRTGQLAFIALMGLLTLQRFARRPLLGITGALVVMMLFFTGAYTGSDYFHERTDTALRQLSNFEAEVDSAVGLRIVYNINSWRVFSEHPLTGVGTGDFREAYRVVNERHTPEWTPTHNPHSQYFLVLTTTGILGGIVLLLVYLPPALLRIPYRDGFDRIRIALPVLFLIISALESYLWRTNTSLMFVLFSALLYADAPTQKSRVADK